jgi:hypothetical protein
MKSMFVVFGMLLIFVAVMYGLAWLQSNRLSIRVPLRLGGMDDDKKFPVMLFLVALVISCLGGFVLLSYMFRSPHRKHRARPQAERMKTTSHGNDAMKPLLMDKPGMGGGGGGGFSASGGGYGISSVRVSQALQKLKVIVYDHPKDLKPAVLDKCKDREITVVEGEKVRCVAEDSDEGKELMEPKQMQQQAHPPIQMSLPKKPPMVVQGFLFQAKPTVKKPDRPLKERSLKDRYAEALYFLMLVLGVLSKHYWDYSKAKDRGEHVEFQPNRIVLALIIAMLVYFSVQQGLENEADKFSFRSLLFAFTNGFTWQTILEPAGDAGKRVEKPSERAS